MMGSWRGVLVAQPSGRRPGHRCGWTASTAVGTPWPGMTAAVRSMPVAELLPSTDAGPATVAGVISAANQSVRVRWSGPFAQRR
jgi:hypothetical protein